MVFVDDEGLEEQFLTEDEASQNILDITANRVTPMDTASVGHDIQLQEEELVYSPPEDPGKRALLTQLTSFLMKIMKMYFTLPT